MSTFTDQLRRKADLAADSTTADLLYRAAARLNQMDRCEERLAEVERERDAAREHMRQMLLEIARKAARLDGEDKP